MSDGVLNLAPRVQLSAIGELRWRLFVNALRSTRGKLELLSQIVIGIGFASGGIAGATSLGFGAAMMFSAGRPDLLALLFWFVFLFWQVFPIMATAFSSNPDAADLLRFPLSYRSYFLVRLAYGSVDPATAMGTLWSLGILVGVGVEKPALLPWTLLVMVAFVAFNLVFMQMIFVWVERWLAQRRSREIMGVLFILLLLCFQLTGPLLAHFGKRARPDMKRYLEILAPVQRVLPPGLAGDAIAEAAYPHRMVSFSSFALLCGFVLVVGYTLHVRLLAQYRGENLSEVAATVKSVDRSLRLGWKLPGLPAPVAAVFEKEVRYLLRSGPTLLTLIMPVFVLVLIRLGAMNAAQKSGLPFAHVPDLPFPAAAGYTLLMLTNLVCNCFGGDAAGIQFFFASPVSFREIVLAKNLTHSCILAFEVVVTWMGIALLYGPPSFAITIATLAGLLFAAPLNFAVGNLLSLYSPKKIDYSSFRHTRPSQVSVLISLGVQLFIIGLGVLVFWIGRLYGNYWITTLIFLLLSAISLTAYRVILHRVEALALERQETLVAELCRA
jgi:ABC-2 type transport system permease protein